MTPKKIAVGTVHAIHPMFMRLASHPAQGEALGDVVAHEVDHERAGNDGQHARGGEQAPVDAGALTVRVIVAAIGLALTDVSVRASSSSTQENMKQKNAVTPTPAR